MQLMTRALFNFLLAAAFLPAQAPHEAWMTLETEPFRVHYPADYEAWTLDLAPKLESIHAIVTEEVSYVPKETVDILVMDPVSQSNGMALPILKHPRMVLWATPPESWSPIGHYRDWPELLFLHEDVHLVHLLRPSRGGWGKFIEWMLPVGAVGRKAPRWVSEGYATYLEGKMTGVGRPNGDFRAAVLRKWALEGKLPSYGQMSNDAESWMGMSMAYLMGSAYMEWLVQRTDEGVWKRLWARLTAKKDRSFDAAFEGIFGDAPAKLYDRFTADLTWRAKELEREMKPALANGELWQDTSWTTGEPALSPDGKKMAIVLRAKDEPSRLVVWDTQPDPEAQKKWDESIEKIRKDDPEDVPGMRTKPFPAKELFRMPTSAAREPMNPRWMPDGKSVLFTSFEPDLDGFFSPDLFLWTPETGTVRRVTKGAHVKEADPLPGGGRAVAVRTRFGKSALVLVDLAVGGIQELTEPSLEQVFSHPRVGPGGRRAVCVRHGEGRWDLVHFALDGRYPIEPASIAIPDGALPMLPAWSADGRSVFASIGSDGFVDIVVSDPHLDALGTPVTRTMGAALAPEPTPDGQGLFYLSLEPDGLAVRYLAFDQAAVPLQTTGPDPVFAPAVRPVPPQGLEFKTQETGAPKPYGAGRQEFSLLFGGHWTSYTEAWEAGVRGGDVLGRWNYFLAGGAGRDGAPEGGTFALGWRGWPVEVTGQVYQVEQNPSEQSGLTYGGPYRSWDRDRKGAALTVGRDWAFARGMFELEGGGLWEEVRHFGREEDAGRRFAYAEARGRRAHPVGGWEVWAGLDAREEWGENYVVYEWRKWTRTRWVGNLGLRKGESGLSVGCEQRVLNGWGAAGLGGPNEGLTLGGVESSLLPRAAQFNAILDPALPAAVRFGDRYEGWRIDLALGGLPLFYQRHRLWMHYSPKGDWLDLAGLEWDMTSGPLAIARLPGLHLTLGGAYIFDAPLEGKTRFWLGLSWRP